MIASYFFIYAIALTVYFLFWAFDRFVKRKLANFEMREDCLASDEESRIIGVDNDANYGTNVVSSADLESGSKVSDGAFDDEAVDGISSRRSSRRSSSRHHSRRKKHRRHSSRRINTLPSTSDQDDQHFRG